MAPGDVAVFAGVGEVAPGRERELCDQQWRTGREKREKRPFEHGSERKGRCKW